MYVTARDGVVRRPRALQRPLFVPRSPGRIDLAARAGIEDLDLQPDGAANLPYGLHPYVALLQAIDEA
jgi:hypothetical protein